MARPPLGPISPPVTDDEAMRKHLEQGKAEEDKIPKLRKHAIQRHSQQALSGVAAAVRDGAGPRDAHGSSRYYRRMADDDDKPAPIPFVVDVTVDRTRVQVTLLLRPGTVVAVADTKTTTEPPTPSEPDAAR